MGEQGIGLLLLTLSFDALFFSSQTRIWVSFIGFTLFFGPILVKAWRVYYIFRSIKLKKKVNLQ